MNSYELENNSTFNTEHNKVGIYCRVSTQDQAREGFSLPEQEARLKALCIYKGYEIVDIYIEKGLSAKKGNYRPEYERLLNDVKFGRVNRIVAFKLDRITRSIIDLEKLVDYLEENNCSLESACEEINTSNANGRFFVRMLTILAQLEIERCSERTIVGIDGAIKAKHLPIKCPLGYKKIDKVLEIDEKTAPIVREVFDLYINGKSTCQIAQELTDRKVLDKTWRNNTIGKIINNRIYIGEYVEHKVVPDKPQKIHYDMAPMIIDRDTFYKAQEQKEKSSIKHFIKRTYIFHKKINCPICDTPFTCICGKSKTGNVYLYYKCFNCKPRYAIGEVELEKEFVSSINELLDYYSILDNSFITLNTINYDHEINALTQEINEIDTRIENAKLLLLDKEITPNEMRATIERLEYEKKEKQLNLQDLISRNNNLVSIDNNNYYNQRPNYYYDNISCFVSNNNLWNKLSAKQKQDIVNKYIDSIEIELDNNKKAIIKKINIKENRVADFGMLFRHDIYNMLYKDNKNVKVSINANLYKHYNLSVENINGKMVNIDNINSLNIENISLLKYD